MNPMFQFDERLENFLETMPRPKRENMMVWFAVNERNPKAASESLNAVLHSLSEASSQETLKVYADSHPKEWVEMTVLNEFGPDFRNRAAFASLVEGIYNRLFA